MKISISKSELERLADVISEVEQKTDGELRLVLAERSGGPGSAYWIIWMIFICLAILMLQWNPLLGIQYSMVARLFGVVFISGLLAKCLSMVPFIERVFLGSAELKQRAELRAELEFYREGMGRTRASTGILLFLSNFERQAVVLGDRAIDAKVDSRKWGQVIQLILGAGKDGKWSHHLELAIRECGKILAENFPATSSKNELSNHVVVKP